LIKTDNLATFVCMIGQITSTFPQNPTKTAVIHGDFKKYD